VTRIYRPVHDTGQLMTYTIHMATDEIQYHVFLMRVWQSRRHPAGDWLAQVEILPSGDRLYFSSPEQLLAYVRKQLYEAGDHDSRRDIDNTRRTR